MRYDTWALVQVGRLIMVTTAIVIAGSAAAQKPSPAQISAVRTACRADYQTHCAEVPTGGAPALACLQKNLASLSTSCQHAVNSAVGGLSPDTVPASTPAATPPAGEGAATGEAPATPGSSGAQAPVAAPAPAASPTKPTRAQASRIRQACRDDFQTHCTGVTPGGSAALACLEAHAANLSAGCQQTLGALGTQPPEAGAATSAPAAGEQEAPVRSPRQEAAIIRFACGPDYRSYCRGLPPGGGRIIGCLKANAVNLSPRCQRALTSLRAGR
jgi:Cysteine rich repeat